MSLAHDFANYLNAHYRGELDRLTEAQTQPNAWAGGVWVPPSVPAPRMQMFEAFNLMRGFLEQKGEGSIRLVVSGRPGGNLFEAAG